MEAAETPDLHVGAIFAGRYRIERRIAAGGMGAVYEVLHLETNRRRALKVMHAQLVQSEELRGRFRQEARVAAEIQSEHIVDVFDAGIDEATKMPFLVMELLRGEELGHRVRSAGPMSPDEVVGYLHQTSLALDKTHRAHVVHRDLKPDNLFLCERDEGPPKIKVLDFGIAKIVADSSTQANATRSLGTPLYMAPEQFTMDAGVSPATDIYALGMIAFTLLVGKPYWFEESKRGASVFAFATVAVLGPSESAVARAQRLGVALPPSFDAWFARATAARTEDRFPSAGVAVKELAAALGLPPPGLTMTSSGLRTPLTSPSFGAASGAALPAIQKTIPLTAGVDPQGHTPLGEGRTFAGSGVTTPAPARTRSTAFVIVAGLLLFGLVGAVFFWMRASPESAAPATPSAPTASTMAAATAESPEVAPVAEAEARDAGADASAQNAPGQTTTRTIVAPQATRPQAAKPASPPPAKTAKKPGDLLNND